MFPEREKEEERFLKGDEERLDDLPFPREKLDRRGFPGEEKRRPGLFPLERPLPLPFLEPSEPREEKELVREKVRLGDRDVPVLVHSLDLCPG